MIYPFIKSLPRIVLFYGFYFLPITSKLMAKNAIWVPELDECPL